MTHRELCNVAGKYLFKKGIVPFYRCQYAFVELERIGERPDAIGFNGNHSQLIEVKVSRGDFLADKKKYWRKHPWNGLGAYRSYMCPRGLINYEELPEKWGLIYVDEEGKISIIKEPERQESNKEAEQHLLLNIMRREGVNPKVRSYKIYKNEQ